MSPTIGRAIHKDLDGICCKQPRLLSKFLDAVHLDARNANVKGVVLSIGLWPDIPLLPGEPNPRLAHHQLAREARLREAIVGSQIEHHQQLAIPICIKVTSFVTLWNLEVPQHLPNNKALIVL